MSNKDQFRKKCPHMLKLLSGMRTSQIIITNKKADDLVVDLFCEQCQQWCFGVEIGYFDNRTYDYGLDLVPKNIDIDSDAAYVNMRLAQEHKSFKAALQDCARIGCLNSVFRQRPTCSEGTAACATCRAKNVLAESQINL